MGEAGTGASPRCLGPSSYYELLQARRSGVGRTRLFGNSNEAPLAPDRLLPPSPGPTQVGTTPEVRFRAVVGPDDELEMEVKL
jgi:hypothetical protein